jgi:hypothetical protein
VVFGEPLFGGWSIRTEADAPSAPNALCQAGIAEFPALALGTMVYADLSMSTRFKPIGGRVDQAAGLTFRVQDDRNYYVLRANALERNVNFYRYSGGRRSPLAEGPIDVASARWQTWQQLGLLGPFLAVDRRGDLSSVGNLVGDRLRSSQSTTTGKSETHAALTSDVAGQQTYARPAPISISRLSSSRPSDTYFANSVCTSLRTSRRLAGGSAEYACGNIPTPVSTVRQ